MEPDIKKQICDSLEGKRLCRYCKKTIEEKDCFFGMCYKCLADNIVSGSKMKISINQLSDAYVFGNWEVWNKMLGVNIHSKEEADIIFNKLKSVNGEIKYEK